MIERGETAGDMIGRVEGSRGRGDQPDALSLPPSAESSVNGSNDVTVAAPQRLDRHVEDSQMVGQEGIELRGFELLRKALQMAE